MHDNLLVYKHFYFLVTLQVRRCSFYSYSSFLFPPYYIYRISFRLWKGIKRNYDGSTEDCPSCQTSLSFSTLCLHTSFLISLSNLLPDISICKHLKTFPSHAVILATDASRHCKWTDARRHCKWKHNITLSNVNTWPWNFRAYTWKWIYHFRYN